MAYYHDKHGDDTAHPDETVAIRAAQVGHVFQHLLDWECAGEVIRRQGVGVGDAAWNRRMSQLRDINPADMGTNWLNDTGAFDRCDRVCCACTRVPRDGEPAVTNVQGQVIYAATQPVLEVTVWYCNLRDQEGRGDGRMPVCSSCVRDCISKGRCPERFCTGFSRHNCCTRRIPQGLLRDVACLEDIFA